ncbi:Uncharacterised protein [Mycobacteroides abscessus subsp. abscessus]|nr:Uncharacterised protein [Mycobacteroides abscessus subsp. abscessus]
MPKGIPLMDGSVSAPVTATTTSPPITRNDIPPSVTSMVARLSGLATNRLAKECELRSAAPDRPTPMAALPTRPRSCTRASGPVRITSRVGLMPSPPETAHVCRV